MVRKCLIKQEGEKNGRKRKEKEKGRNEKILNLALLSTSHIDVYQNPEKFYYRDILKSSNESVRVITLLKSNSAALKT